MNKQVDIICVPSVPCKGPCQQLLTERYSLDTDRDSTLWIITAESFWAEADPDKYDGLGNLLFRSKEILWAGRDYLNNQAISKVSVNGGNSRKGSGTYAILQS